MKKKTQLENISTYGLPVEITTSQTQNGLIIQEHWVKFNAKLKRLKLNQNAGNWEKYGFTYKVNEKYFYMASIPFSGQNLPENFEYMLIPKGEYLVFEHTGKMSAIKNTIYEIYKIVLPQSKTTIKDHLNVGFVHFEKYDFRFKWNKPNSIIEIHLPLDTISK